MFCKAAFFFVGEAEINIEFAFDGFENIKHRDLTGLFCERESALYAAVGTYDLGFDEFLEYFGEEASGDFVLLRNFINEAYFLKGLPGKIQHTSNPVITFTSNLHIFSISISGPMSSTIVRFFLSSEALTLLISVVKLPWLLCYNSSGGAVYRAILRTVFLAGSLLLASSCHTKQEGAVEGSVTPPSPGVRVTIDQSGKTVSAIEADKKDGTFRVALAPGRYDISVIAPSSPFPVNFESVSVDPGKTASLPPVRLVQLSGSASLAGTVLPAGTNIKVTLLSEGQERATINASPEGRYEFTSLSPGSYTLQATAPGYAGGRAAIQISEDRRASQNMRLLYVTPIDGIDWGREVIRAKGRGIYPASISNRTAMHEMAKRAALSAAERNLLLMVEQIKLDPNHDLKSTMSGSTFTVRISGFLKGYKVVEERDVDNGVEVELELPLTGPGGLTGYISN